MNKGTYPIIWENFQKEYKGELECDYSPIGKIAWNSGSVVTSLTAWILTLTGLMGGTNQGTPKIDFSFSEDFNSEAISNYIKEESRGEVESLRQRLMSETSELVSLGDNWDGEGAYGVSVKSLISVLSMLELDENTIRLGLISDICPNRNGTVSIQWDNDEGEMIGLEMGQRKMAYFVTKNEGSTYHNQLEINDENFYELFKDLATL